MEITELISERLVLEPLRVDHATEMVTVLAGDELYTFTGGAPPSLDELRRRYRAQVAGGAPHEIWLNWVARQKGTNTAVGFVQATIEDDQTLVAWTIGAAWQNRGYATEAAGCMCSWLQSIGSPPRAAWIHPEHRVSQRVAEALGFVLTDEVDDDGEQRWAASQRRGGRADSPSYS